MSHYPPLAAGIPGFTVVDQEDHRKRVLPRNRMGDITFEASDDPPHSNRGIGLLELPGDLTDAEGIHRLRNPHDVVFNHAHNLMDLWLMWPDYNNRRGINWPVRGCHTDPDTGAVVGITRKEVAIGVRELLLHFFDRYNNRVPFVSGGGTVRFPIGDGFGQISRQHVTVVKVYHLGGTEWQIELQIPDWVLIKSEPEMVIKAESL